MIIENYFQIKSRNFLIFIGTRYQSFDYDIAESWPDHLNESLSHFTDTTFLLTMLDVERKELGVDWEDGMVAEVVVCVVSTLSKLPGPQTVSRVCPYFHFSFSCRLGGMCDFKRKYFKLKILLISTNHHLVCSSSCCHDTAECWREDIIAQPSVSAQIPTDTRPVRARDQNQKPIKISPAHFWVTCYFEF